MPDISHDQVDAILRDPNVPEDVRASVVAYYAVTRYLDSVEFYTDDAGVSHVRPKSADPAPSEAASTPADVTPSDVTPSPPTDAGTSEAGDAGTTTPADAGTGEAAS